MRPTSTRRRLLLAGAATVPLLAGRRARAAGKVRVALGDVVSTETLCVLLALERARERGTEYELTSFSKEDLAIQAVIGGQADLGIGTPYAVVQRTRVPLAILFQVNRLVFFPVVDKAYRGWKDLDGQPFAFHARGSGTEAIGNIIARREGIAFGQRSYVPGSENRVVALLNGQIRATILDLANKNLILEKAPDRFHVLPGVDRPASDETLFGRRDWIAANRPAVDTIVEAMLDTWRRMVKEPDWIESERARRGLLADRPAELLAGVPRFYREAVAAGVFAADGGGAEAARADLEFYTEAGQLQGPATALAVEDFWDLGPLEAARRKLGA